MRTLVPDNVAPDLLAVLGESLSNASRHAARRRAGPGGATTSGWSVSDNGRGMDEGVRESGLGNMRERAVKHGGDVAVESASGSGTTVTWTVPIVEGGSTIQGG